MKIPFIATILLLFSITSGLSGQETEPKRVFFLGNSVFHSKGGLCPSFLGFCREAGLDFQVFTQYETPPSRLDVKFLGFGRIPLNLPAVAAEERIHELIRSGNFDYVILEGRRNGFLLPESAELPEERGQSIPYNENLKALAALHRTIVESGAQTVLYMHPGLHTLPDIKHPVAQIYRRFRDDLSMMEINGTKHEVVLVPAMLLWLDAIRHYGVDGWYADPGHGNALARYASACMLYTYITGRDPRENGYRKLTELTRDWRIIPEKSDVDADEKDANWIKNQVWLYYSTKPK